MIAVIDFGSQYTHLICRRIRELGAPSEVFPYCDELPSGKKIDGIILSGSPAALGKTKAPLPADDIFARGAPILGICYGMQVIAKMLGGKIVSCSSREYGETKLNLLEKGALFRGFPASIKVWMSHFDRVGEVPGGFKVLARTRTVPVAAMGDASRKIYGLQFHPEVTHTEKGLKILDNFIKLCGAERSWKLGEWVENEIKRVKSEVGRGKVIMALSGGVDSTVASVIIKRAVGTSFYPIFVDHGLTRWKDLERINNVVSKKMGIKVRCVDAADRFIEALKGVRDPEKKRKIIGREFINVFQEEAAKIPGVTHLAQGTLYPDVIESACARSGAAPIKSHHNVGGLPESLNLKLVEPFRFLYKDEVRRIGLLEGVPEEIVHQHPFPGPGLAVRIIGEINRKRINILRKADQIMDEELKKAGLYYGLWQAFPVFLPVRSVGVMGDTRTYGNVIALRCVESKEAMTASWAPLPHSVLGAVSTRIVNEIKGINRVVYDITNKPPGTIEWE